MHTHRRAADPQDLGHLGGRVARVATEQDRGTLVRRQRRERPDHTPRLLIHRVVHGEVGKRAGAAAVAELAGRDAERGGPYPRAGIGHGVAPAQALGERLGHGVVGERPVLGEREDRAPEAGGLRCEDLAQVRQLLRPVHAPPAPPL